VDQGSDIMQLRPGAAALPPLQSASPTAPQQLPKAVPAPAPPAPPSAATVTAQLKDLPAPPPRVVVRNAVPAPAGPPAPPAPPPVMQWPAPWLPPILQPPPYYNPQLQSPQWYPSPRGPWSGHGGSRHGHGEGD